MIEMTMMAFPLRPEFDRSETTTAAQSQLPSWPSRLAAPHREDESGEQVIEGEWCEPDARWATVNSQATAADAIEVQWWESKPQTPSTSCISTIQCLKAARAAAIALTAGAVAEAVTQADPAGSRPVSLPLIAPAASAPIFAGNPLTRSQLKGWEPIAAPEMIREPWLGQSARQPVPQSGLALGTGVLLSVGMVIASNQRQLKPLALGRGRFANTAIGVVGY